ncbi:hypothetical protein N665_0283s0031 [Sinapis alba]|nr:hypothetical protein N665_0283s0031 [Sinapis alba]
MEQCGSETPTRSFPHRLFAVGEEPLGIRVTPYHKPSCISKILNALEEEEIDVIRKSPFGKLIEIAAKPSFSGRFGCFLISRQLKVAKRHESWFLFAGKPVRFSIREFALVTGLNCRNYPPHSKKRSKRNISEKPYWGDLFGTMKDVPVRYVISMLKKKTVTDPEIRIKYAFLALLASVVLPTSHTPRVLQEYAEKIKDLDQFLAYPWGRVSFEMLMSSMKERNEVSLSQNTIAFKGFVMAIQLVMIEAVPSLIGVVRDGGSSGSEGESADEDDNCDDDKEGKKSINPGHVRDIDTACKAQVLSIISAGIEQMNVNPELGWSDDEEDVQVDNLVKCIGEGFSFSNSHFTGGATKADVFRMREETKKENVSRKSAKTKSHEPVTDAIDADYVANIVKNSVAADLSKMSEQIKDLTKSLTTRQTLMQNNIQDILDNYMWDIRTLITTPCNRPHGIPPQNNQPGIPVCRSSPRDGSLNVDPSIIIEDAFRFANNEIFQTRNDTVATGPVFPNPTFSLGLTQINNQESDAADAPLPLDENGAPAPNRKSTCRCSLSLDNRELSAIVDRSSHLPAKVVDTLVQHTRSVFLSNVEHIQYKNSVFLDTKFVSQLAKSFVKFSKSSRKDSFRFQSSLCDYILGDCLIGEANRFYFPFNFDKQHWVGVCVDVTISQVIVLDCNTTLRTDGIIAKDLRPISQIFPYLLRQAGKSLSAKDLKPLTIERPRIVPQNNNQFESGVTSILLIQAHAVGGVDVCKCITLDVLDVEVQRIVVMMYEENLGVL